jgi:oligoribonuclease NrnB/cAMP/cGMP phosphodiesterase (DHH superfamily)
MSKVLCIYHKNCPDGFAAAWVVWLAHGQHNQRGVEFVQADYGDPVPDLTGRDVYIVDFSWKPELLLPEAIKAKSVHLIDHHTTAFADWCDAIYDLPKGMRVDVDVGFSGAVLVWNVLLKEPTGDHIPKVPHLFRVLQDYDLYTLEMEGTKDIVTALRPIVQAQNFAAFHDYVMLEEGSPVFDTLCDEGHAINAYREMELREMLKRNTTHQRLFGHEGIPVCNVPYEYRDLAGEILSKDAPFSVTYDDWLSRGTRKFSLRSTKGVGVDVEEIAKRQGGGGHKHAASFSEQIQPRVRLVKPGE